MAKPVKKRICWAKGCENEITDEDSFVCEEHKDKDVELDVPVAVGNPNIP